jgi:hypothetical protein
LVFRFNSWLLDWAVVRGGRSTRKGRQVRLYRAAREGGYVRGSLIV